MGYFAIEDEEELQHHGILGQKWGVRRFQRPDGTRTPAGKKRQRENYENAQNGGHKKEFDKEKAKKIAKGVALGVAGAAAAYGAAKFIQEYNEMPDFLKKELKDAAKTKLTDIGDKAKNKFGKRLSKVGDRMIDAALMSVGGIAISKLTKKLTPPEDASEAQKIGSKVAIDTASAGIRTMTGGSNNSNYNGGNKNSGAKVDKSSDEYKNLFNGLEDDKSARDKIKEMANEGASIEDLQKYRESIQHYDFDDWNESFVFSEFRW